MKKETLTHISSIICLGFFLLLAFGSVDENSSTDSTYSTETDNSSYEPEPPKNEVNAQTQAKQQKPEPEPELQKDNGNDDRLDMAKKWVGDWVGKEKCNMGRGAGQWSNPYTIHFRMEGNETYLRGIYFQANKEITVNVTETELKIDEQNIGESSFVIRGQGKREGNILTIQYEVDVLVDIDNNTYETNSCVAEFKIKEEGVFEVEIERQGAMAVQLPSKGTWCLWEIQGGNRVWLEGYVPGASNGYGKYDVYSEQLPMYLGDEKKFTLTNASISSGIVLVFKKCEYK